jgi:hypothetical protein
MFVSNKKKKKRLSVGVHAAVIKRISMVVDHTTMEPLTTVDPNTGETVGGIDILFMGADEHGTILRIWLTEQGLAEIRSMCKAVGIENSDNEQIPVNEIIGKRLFVVVAKAFIYDNYQPRKEPNGDHIWMPEAQPVFFKCVDPAMVPKVPGDPNFNNGVASGEFIKHRDYAIGLIDPPAANTDEIDLSKVVLI